MNRLTAFRVLLVCVSILLSGCGDHSEALPAADSMPSALTDDAASAPSPGRSAEPWQYPRTRVRGETRLVIHAPQIRAWPEFRHFEADIVVELSEPEANTSPRYAAVTVSGETTLDFEGRLVTIESPVVSDVKLGTRGTASDEALLKGAVENDRIEMPLDVFLLSLEENVLGNPDAEGFSAAVPDIRVAFQPTFVLSVLERPFLLDLESTGLKLVMNANWPLLKHAVDDHWLLLFEGQWLRADVLEGPWTPTSQPEALSRLDPDGPHANLLQAPEPVTGDLPVIIYATEPTELVVIDGKPQLSSIEGVAGLRYVSNTDTPLLYYEARWYYTAAGRWFTTAELEENGQWTMVGQLPDSFRDIPEGHELGWLLASIPGTAASRLAILEASLPRTTNATPGAGPEVMVSYDGAPQFEIIPGTQVSRAVSSPYQVLKVGSAYYLCLEGVWYVASAPRGPWEATAVVPAAIYDIPPESPSYSVTDVSVTESSASSITYSHTDAYESGAFVVGAAVLYSTGWYYPPYLGGIYYPYPVSYGYGRHYNPDTGAFAHRSVWYGPYGGYSYAEGYNPTTGRYGYRETAWDGDEWASYSEVYGQNREIEARSKRSYDEDSGKAKLERDIEGPGGNKIETNRTTNFDDNWQRTERESSRGGSSTLERSWDEDGSLQSQGTIEAADGRTATISGSYQDGDGTTTITGSEGGQATIDRERQGDTVTREGQITGADGEQISSSTTRDGARSVTELESGSGGQAKSVSKGGDRVTLAESASGDKYAGRNGEIYKKTDEGWQSYDRDSQSWQGESFQSQRSERDAATTAQRTSQQERQRLERDARARQQGYSRFEQRRGRAGMAGGRRGRGRR